MTRIWSPALTTDKIPTVTAARPEGVSTVPAAPAISVQARSSASVVGVPLVP